MIDPRSHQCNRPRSLVIRRGVQWSVTSNGVETTDLQVPHVVIAAADLDRIDDILDGTYATLLPRGAEWLDEGEFQVMLEHAKDLHQRRPR